MTSAKSARLWAVGRWLRRLGGGSDQLATVTPQDRAHYTVAGLTMLLTFLVSGGTLGTALALMVPGLGFWTLLVAAFWGLITLSMDRQLVLTLPRRRWRAVVWAAPMVTLAVLLSVVVWTPLELWFFRHQIETRLGPGRPSFLGRLQALNQLREVNPLINAEVLVLEILWIVLFCLPVLVRLFRPQTVQDTVAGYLEGDESTARARTHFRRVERTPLAGPPRRVPSEGPDQG